MRSTHVTITHRPLDVRIFGREARALIAAGYEVHLVVAGPPTATVEGVALHSVANDSDRPPARRQPARFLRAARWAFRLRPSVYHLHEVQLIPLGLLLKLAGQRVVYDVHEDYPAHARGKLVDHPLRGHAKALMWTLLERLASRAFDGFVCASPAIARKFPPSKTTVVRNFPIRRPFALAEADGARPYDERSNTIVYSGVFRAIRSLWEVTRALELVAGELDCRLHVIGEIRPPELALSAGELPGWRRVEISPWLPHSTAVRRLYDARIGLALLHPLPNHGDPIRSNKLLEYMAAGIPVVAPDLPEWRRLVEELGCGLVVDPLDPAAIAAAFERLLRHPEEARAMGERGRAAVEAGLNWHAEAPRLLSFYRELLSASSIESSAGSWSSSATLTASRRRRSS